MLKQRSRLWISRWPGPSPYGSNWARNNSHFIQFPLPPRVLFILLFAWIYHFCLRLMLERSWTLSRAWRFCGCPWSGSASWPRRRLSPRRRCYGLSTTAAPPRNPYHSISFQHCFLGASQSAIAFSQNTRNSIIWSQWDSCWCQSSHRTCWTWWFFRLLLPRHHRSSWLSRHASKGTSASPPPPFIYIYLSNHGAPLTFPTFILLSPSKSIIQSWMACRRKWLPRSSVWKSSFLLSPLTGTPGLHSTGWPSSSWRPGHTAPCCRPTNYPCRSPVRPPFSCSWAFSSYLTCFGLSPCSVSSESPAARTYCPSLRHTRCWAPSPPSTTQWAATYPRSRGPCPSRNPPSGSAWFIP